MSSTENNTTANDASAISDKESNSPLSFFTRFLCGVKNKPRTVTTHASSTSADQEKVGNDKDPDSDQHDEKVTKESSDDRINSTNQEDEDEDEITPPPMNFRAISGGMSTKFVVDKDGAVGGSAKGGPPGSGKLGGGMARAPSIRGGGLGGGPPAGGGLQRSQSSWIRKDQVGVSG